MRKMYELGRVLIVVFLCLPLTGCGPDGEQLARDFLEGLDSYLYDDSYGDFGEDDVDCSDPILTRTEPLPSGTHPDGWITTRNNYWDCDGSKEYYHADGTFSGRFTDTSFEGYNEFLTVWRACRVGTRLPEVTGDWVVVNDNILCVRFDTTPGVIACSDIVSEPDGNSAATGGDIEVIQYGRVIASDYQGADTCYLEQE